MNRLKLFFLVALLAACSNRSGIPSNIIPPDSMEKIMREMIIASQYSLQYITKDSLKRDKVKANQDLMEIIFKQHRTTRAAFKQSLDFYQSRPDLNKIIFDSLAADANRKKADLNIPHPLGKPVLPPPKKADLNIPHPIGKPIPPPYKKADLNIHHPIGKPIPLPYKKADLNNPHPKGKPIPPPSK